MSPERRPSPRIVSVLRQSLRPRTSTSLPLGRGFMMFRCRRPSALILSPQVGSVVRSVGAGTSALVEYAVSGNRNIRNAMSRQSTAIKNGIRVRHTTGILDDTTTPMFMFEHVRAGVRGDKIYRLPKFPLYAISRQHLQQRGAISRNVQVCELAQNVDTFEMSITYSDGGVCL